MKKNLIVFLRHYNDIDHITPVIYYILSNKEDLTVDIVLTESYQFKHISNYSFSDDYRINAINEFDNCEVHYLSNIAFDRVSGTAKKTKEEILVPRIKSWGKKIPTKLPKKAWDLITSKSVSEAQNWSEIADRTYENLIKYKKDAVIVFDWIRSTSNKGEFVNSIVEQANDDNHTTISLPHGDNPYANHWMTNHNSVIEDPDFGTEPIQELYYGQNPIPIDYDWFVVPNKLVKERYTAGNLDNIVALGSPRYNEKSIDMLSSLSPKFQSGTKSKQWNVVFFTRQPSFNISQDALAEIIRMLYNFDSMSVVVKHHTRSRNDALNNAFYNQTGNYISEMESVELVFDDVHSNSLLEWGDLFVDVGVSVIFEAIMRNKPVLEIDYSHWNKSRAAPYLPDAVVNCRDELYNYLRNANNKTEAEGLKQTYTPAERRKFMKEVIYPQGENVLELYASLILDEQIGTPYPDSELIS